MTPGTQQKDKKSEEKKPEQKKTESGSAAPALSSQEPVFGGKTGSDFSFAAIAAKSPPGGFGFTTQNTGILTNHLWKMKTHLRSRTSRVSSGGLLLPDSRFAMMD